MRIAEIARKTLETDIHMTLCLDGSGKSAVNTVWIPITIHSRLFVLSARAISASCTIYGTDGGV